MLGTRVNPRFREEVRKEPLAGTSLSEAAHQEQTGAPTLTPPRMVSDSETRLEAFEHLDIPLRQKEVLQAILDHEDRTGEAISSIEIARSLRRPIHTISGRLTELRDHEGLIVIEGKKRDERTGRNYALYRANKEKFN